MGAVPAWVLSILEWALALALKNIKPEDVKKELSVVVKAVDAFIASAESKVSGPAKGIADEVEAALHAAFAAIITALDKP